MARDPHYDVLLEPLHVGPKTLFDAHRISCRETDKDDIRMLDRSTIQA